MLALCLLTAPQCPQAPDRARCCLAQDTPFIADTKDLIADSISIGGGLLTTEAVTDVVMRVLDTKSLAGAVVAISAKVGTFVVPYSTSAIVKSGSKL